jgi:hypothetical protein
MGDYERFQDLAKDVGFTAAYLQVWGELDSREEMVMRLRNAGLTHGLIGELLKARYGKGSADTSRIVANLEEAALLIEHTRKLFSREHKEECLQRLVDLGIPVSRIARLIGIRRRTVYNYIKEGPGPLKRGGNYARRDRLSGRKE